MIMRKLKQQKIKKIILFGNATLRNESQSVIEFDKKLIDTVDLIANTLKNQKYAAALAAPQIAINKKITVINYCGEYLELINPEILESKGEKVGYEGCLSLPGFIGKVKRAESIIVKYQDRYGAENIIERTGDMARCIQHEIDHFDGILYIDRVSEEFLYNPDTEEKVMVSKIIEVSK
ncbi:MAG: peptide deformylase [Fusobacteriaceae bacterium]|nr:peptide deformylase [Fusobacteriaceae bacterium]